jgi:hypothetical protein
MRDVPGIRGIVRFDDNFPCRATKRLSSMLLSVTPGVARTRLAPKSTNSASSFESMPCSSGEEVCHCLVGQIGSFAP